MATNLSTYSSVFVISSLLIALVCVNTSFANQLPVNTEFESDNAFLTTRVNQTRAEFSTSVDTVQLLFDSLGYRAPVNQVSIQRSLMKLDEGANVCVVNRIRTNQRADAYRYSLALNFFHTQRLYQLSELPALPSDLLNSNSEVISLSKVFEVFPDAAIVTARGFSYGEKIDHQLTDILPTQKVKLSSDIYYQRAIQLFVKGRIQFGLFFPASVFLQYGSKLPIATRQYIIADNPKFTTGHFICADNAVGRKTIQILNIGIRRLYENPEFLALHTRYLPSNSHAEIADFMQRYIAELSSTNK